MTGRHSLVGLPAPARRHGVIAAAAQGHVSVFFLRGAPFRHVSGPAPTPSDAVRQLLARPTRAEVQPRLSHVPACGHARAQQSRSQTDATVDLDGGSRCRTRHREPARPALAARAHADRAAGRDEGAAPLLNGRVAAARFRHLAQPPITFTAPPRHRTCPCRSRRDARSCRRPIRRSKTAPAQ